MYHPNVQKADILPVVILLHGVYGSAWSWAHQSGVHLKLNELISQGELPPMILVMPSDGLWGDGSAYLPHNNYNFEKWIIEDVIDSVIESIDGATCFVAFIYFGAVNGRFWRVAVGS